MHQCGALVIFDISNVGRLLHSDVLTESLQAFKTSSEIIKNISFIDISKHLSFDLTFVSEKWLSALFSFGHDICDDVKQTRQLSECSNFVLIGQRNSESARKMCAKSNPTVKSMKQHQAMERAS